MKNRASEKIKETLKQGRKCTIQVPILNKKNYMRNQKIAKPHSMLSLRHKKTQKIHRAQHARDQTCWLEQENMQASK